MPSIVIIGFIFFGNCCLGGDRTVDRNNLLDFSSIFKLVMINLLLIFLHAVNVLFGRHLMRVISLIDAYRWTIALCRIRSWWWAKWWRVVWWAISLGKNVRQRPAGNLFWGRHAVVVIVVEIAVLMRKGLKLGLISRVAGTVAVCSSSRQRETVAPFSRRRLGTCELSM